MKTRFSKLIALAAFALAITATTSALAALSFSLAGALTSRTPNTNLSS